MINIDVYLGIFITIIETRAPREVVPYNCFDSERLLMACNFDSSKLIIDEINFRRSGLDNK